MILCPFSLKKFKYISQKEKESIREAYNNWEKYDKAEDIHIGADIYFKAATAAANTIINQSNIYLESANNEILSNISNFFEIGQIGAIDNKV